MPIDDFSGLICVEPQDDGRACFPTHQRLHFVGVHSGYLLAIYCHQHVAHYACTLTLHNTVDTLESATPTITRISKHQLMHYHGNNHASAQTQEVHRHDTTMTSQTPSRSTLITRSDPFWCRTPVRSIYIYSRSRSMSNISYLCRQCGKRL